ncbi:lipase family protein [Corynebacterium anserum]|uniref:lipase family protein n=1 Tax=Corynebacterium anserum TaxID=2684406 RepID=UPI0021AE65EF|nr:lipase family protein [Corynebacterium anserum]
MTLHSRSYHRISARLSTAAVAATTSVLLAATCMTGVAGAEENSGVNNSNPAYDTVDGSMRGASDLGSGETIGAIGSVNLQEDDFYTSLPRFIDGKPGQVLKSQPSNFALGIPKIDWTNTEATRIAYVSTNSQGKTVPVTGTVFTSSAPWKGKGPRPLLTIAPGTQGAGDACSPGITTPYGLDYEGAPIAAALARGWNVALTDLMGLGTKPQHTYMNREDQGHATLDMARATLNLKNKNIPANSPVATWGYSQGGGASASALELQPTYAPDLNLVTGYAGGVPADLAVTAEGVDGMVLAGAMGYTINGMLYAYPELRPELDKQLNDKGREVLNQTKDECIVQSLLRQSFRDSRELTKDGRSLSEILKSEPIASAVRKQEIGHLKPKVPVYIGHGTHDDVIPVRQARHLARTWCSKGVPVYYQEQRIPSVAPLVNHMVPMLSHLTPAMEWLEKVINGADYPTTPCGEIPADNAPDGNADFITPGSVEGAGQTSSDGVPGSLESKAYGSSAGPVTKR